jgi:pimeloyl-ACP methyl ester carboxylesterase
MLLHVDLVTAAGATPTRAFLFLHGILGQGTNLRTLARRFVEARPMVQAVLVDLRAPVLFVPATRDAKAPLDALAAVRARMTAHSALHVVPTGDHSLQVTRAHTRATGRTQADEDDAALAAIRAFLSSVIPGRTGSSEVS